MYRSRETRILVIEQDEAIVGRISLALEKAGYEVVIASDIPDGLQRFNDTHPSLVIVDGEVSAVKEEIPYQQIRRASYIPIIVLGNEESRVETLEGGADAYMIKPPEIRELTARVKALLRRRPAIVRDPASVSKLPTKQ